MKGDVPDLWLGTLGFPDFICSLVNNNLLPLKIFIIYIFSNSLLESTLSTPTFSCLKKKSNLRADSEGHRPTETAGRTKSKDHRMKQSLRKGTTDGPHCFQLGAL